MPPSFRQIAVLSVAAGLSTRSPTPQQVPFVLTRLSLEVQVDYERGAIKGIAALHLRNVSGRSAGTVPLLLNRLMAVSRIETSAGASVAFAQDVVVFEDDSIRQVNAILATPGSPLAAGDSCTLKVHYQGRLVGYTETGSLYIKDQVRRDFTILREDAYAFPMLGVPSWHANRAAPRPSFDFTTRITVPPDLVVATAGELIERTGDSLVTWAYRSSGPVPFLNIAIAPYRILDTAVARIFYFPSDSTGAHLVAQAIAGAVERYTGWYGPLGREPRLVVMEIPEGFGSQASLTAGIIQTADAFRARSELRQLYHELAHLWNVADLDQPSPRWNEGLASFLQWRMAAELDGWTDWTAQLERTVSSLLRRCGQPVSCDSIPFVGYGRSGLTDRSYSVGLLLFYALSHLLGPERFDRAYRGFYQQYRVTGATTGDLVAAFRRASPKSDRVFDEWLFSTRWYSRLASGESIAQIVNGYQREP